jgi:hypothetical protein
MALPYGLVIFALIATGCSDPPAEHPPFGRVWLWRSGHEQEAIPVYQLGEMSWSDISGENVLKAVQTDSRIVIVDVSQDAKCTCCQTVVTLRDDTRAPIGSFRSRMICHDEFPNH